MQESKKFGLLSIILLGINTIVGSGIFLLPGQVAAQIGNWSLIVYLIVTAMIASIAWCFAKCAALFNRDGGAYLYAKHAFGDFVGFEIGVMRWATSILAWASLAVGFVTALSTIWPEVVLEPTRSIIIVSLVGGLSLINSINFGVVKFMNNAITIAKLAALLLFISAGVFFVKQTNVIGPLPPLDPASSSAAIMMIFYAFAGFEALVVPAGEMKNPKRNLPIAVMTTLLICAFIYFSVQLVAAGTLGPALATSVSPMSDVAEMVLGPYGKALITVAMLISIGGINVAASFVCPKTGVALAQDQMIPAFIAKRNRFDTPYVAILVSAFLVSVLALTGDFTELVVISVVARFATHISTCLAVYVYYKDRLSFKQPGKLLTMFIPIIALSGIAWLIFQTPAYQLVIGFAALVLCAPLYFLWKPANSDLTSVA